MPADNSLPFVSLIDSKKQVLQGAGLAASGADIFIGKKHDCQEDCQGDHSREENRMCGTVKVDGILCCTHWAGV